MSTTASPEEKPAKAKAKAMLILPLALLSSFLA